MSWAKDEWKQNLPPNALQKIVALEDEVEDLRKVKQQQLCQYEGLQAAFQKQKQMNGDEKVTNANLTQEVQELSQKCSELDRQVERFQSELKMKGQKVDLLEDQVQRAKQKAIEDNEVAMDLQRETGLKQNELRQCVEKNSELSLEFDRKKNANIQLAKDVEAFTAKMKQLTTENESYRDQLFQRVGKINLPVQRKKLGETENTDAESTSGASLETMTKGDKNALMLNEDDELKTDREHMKRAMEDKERELERVGEKLAVTSAELEAKLQVLTAKEKEVKKLKEELSVNESGHNLDVNNQKLAEELECLKWNYATAQETIASITKELHDTQFTIHSMEAELGRKATSMEARRERIEVLQTEKEELAHQLDCLKGADDTAQETTSSAGNEELKKTKLEGELENDAFLIEGKDKRIEVLVQEISQLRRERDCLEQQRRSEDHSSTEMNERETTILKLGADVDEKARQLKEQLQRVEYLLAVNSQLSGELEGLKCDFKELNTSYSAVARALNESRALVEIMRHQLRIKEQQTEEQEVDEGTANEDELTDREVKVNNVNSIVLNKQLHERGTKDQDENAHIAQNRTLGDVTSPTREPGTSVEAGKEWMMSENLSALLAQLQEEHEMVEVKVRQCLTNLQETFGIVESRPDVHDDKRSPDVILIKLGELRVYLDSLLESAFHCRLMICREDRESDPRAPDVNTAFVVGESSREDLSQQGRGHGNDVELSWDDYDREKAFQTFREDVECIVQQLETDKKAAKRKAKEVKRANMALREIRRKSRKRHAGPVSCRNRAERAADGLVGQLQGPSGGPVEAEPPREEYKMDAENPSTHVPIQTAVTEWALEEADTRQPKCCEMRQEKTPAITPSQLAEVVQVVLQESNHESERNLAAHFKRLQKSLQSRHIRLQCAEEEEEEENRTGAGQTKSALDGRYAVSELELSKKQLTGVQRSIKVLISSLAAAEHESEARRGDVERLTRELQESETRHEEECAELKNVMRGTSQQEMALKRRVKSLDAEKEELNNELRQVIEKLKEKELELVGNCRQLRDLETRSTEEKTTLRNKIEALKSENEAIWEDYKSTCKQAEKRKSDLRGITEHLKGSEAQLIAIFHRLCNVDENIQRARERQIYDH